MLKARKVDLTTICGGAIPELFDREMEDVMKNIADPNTDNKKPRTVTITISIFPQQDRQSCQLECGVTSKTIPTMKASGSLFIAKNEKGTLTGYTTDIRQEDLFKEDEAGESAEPTAPLKKPYVLKEAPQSAS